jgi:hypothetical protein
MIFSSGEGDMAKAAAKTVSTPSLPLTPPQGLQVVKAAPIELTGRDLETWQRLAEILSDLDELAFQAEGLKERLRKSLGRGEFTVDGKKAFSIIANRRWDDDKAHEVLADYPQVVAELEAVLLDRDRAHEVLPDAWYHLCQVEVGRDRVVPARRRR